jgi:hypothetical protein
MAIRRPGGPCRQPLFAGSCHEVERIPQLKSSAFSAILTERTFNTPKKSMIFPILGLNIDGIDFLLG